MELVDAKIPYIRFENQPVEDRNASIEAGHVVLKDVPMVHITAPGSKDCVTREVKAWLEDCKVNVDSGRLPVEWLEAYKRAYKYWSETGEIPETGTALRNWPMVTPAQCETLTNMNIRTVEQLAEATEEAIGRLGMGGRALKERAVNWLEASNGDAGKLAMRLEQAETERDQLADTVQNLAETVRQLQSALKANGIGTETVGNEVNDDSGINKSDLGL